MSVRLLNKEGIFYEQRNISAPVITEIFRARLLTVLLEQGVITQELIDMLLSWNHNSGFNVHTKGVIDGADGDATPSPFMRERIGPLPACIKLTNPLRCRKCGAVLALSEAKTLRLLQTTRAQRRYSSILRRLRRYTGKN